MKACGEKSDRYRGDMSPRIEWFGESENCAIVTLDRPEKRNAVDLATLGQLRKFLDEIERRRSRVMILHGAGPAFCSGADLDGVELGEFTDTLSSVLQGLVELPCLTLALIDGPALGAGMQLAAACDLRVATAGSPIGIPAVKLGLAVDAWTVQRVGQEAGWNTARRVLLTGEAIPARDLYGSFIHRIVTDERALDEARDWALHLSLLAPLSIQAHKLAINAAIGQDFGDHDFGLESDATSAAVEKARLIAWASADAVEGRQAFREKRPPRFMGE